jgi:hypothetical protein
MWRIIYLPTADYWPDNKLTFPTKELAQSYFEFRFDLGFANYKYLYEVIEVIQ